MFNVRNNIIPIHYRPTHTISRVGLTSKFYLGLAGISLYTYDKQSQFMLFTNGSYCGFSKDEVTKYLTFIGRITCNYEFTNVIKLERDIENGYFNSIFEKLRYNNKQPFLYNSKGD